MALQAQRFSSHLATLLTMAGLAIGLGNVWRFPYMMGQHGGSAFLFIYVLFMILLAVPALSAEWSLGRSTRGGPLMAFRAAYGPRAGLVLGLFIMSGVFMALCYYSIVVGNVVYSAWFAARHGFSEAEVSRFHAGLGDHRLQYVYAMGVTLASLWIVHRGLRRGIELANRVLVPVFAVIAVYLVGVALSLDGAPQAMLDFLKPDFSAAGPTVWFAAMGQACFSVGLSGVLCVMYGSYLDDREKIVPTAMTTGLMDTGAALLATLFVVPAVLVFGLDMAAGPGLLFDTLPRLFGVMPGGRWLAALFLAGWALVAILSIICTLDAVITGLSDLASGENSRRRWTLAIGLAVLAVMFPIAMNPHWIGTLDLVFGSGMFMLGSLLAIIGVGWGLGETVTRAQIRLGLSPRMEAWMFWWIKWVVPLALAVILLGFIYNTVFTA
ncbi:MAG: sodium-dependent transporter [Xanthomonadales bacterium]|nr:sodium-dependent transporter [Xanthomonadales bacterium]